MLFGAFHRGIRSFTLVKYSAVKNLSTDLFGALFLTRREKSSTHYLYILASTTHRYHIVLVPCIITHIAVHKFLRSITESVAAFTLNTVYIVADNYINI